MGKNKIREIVGKEVREWYDWERGTLDVVMPLTNDTCAVLEKEFGGSPVCHIFFNEDDTTERDLPLLCELIEGEALETVIDITEQADFEGYDDEVPDTFRRDYWPKLQFKGTRGSY